MCAQTENNHAQHMQQQQQRPLHLNMSTPLSAQTLEVIQSEITKDMIAIIAAQAKSVIPCTPPPTITSSDRGPLANSLGSEQISNRIGLSDRLPSPPSTPGGGTLSSVPALDMFITNLVLRSRVQAGTLICTLVYLQRLQKRLPKEARGMECTCHRIFLATLIVAGKYLNDASPKNKYWARYSTVFTVAEVNLMEKQLLFLLDFDLRIDNDDLNKAATVFVTGASQSGIPLTPTTPPFGSSKLQAAILEPVASSLHQQQQKQPAHTHAEAVAKMYPSTLRLGGHQSGQPISADQRSIKSDTVYSVRYHGLSKRQLPYDKTPTTRSLAAIGQDHVKQRSVSEYHDVRPKTAAGPLQHISANDKTQLRPSPKKRAVSRGYLENVPQPSPVYYCGAATQLGSTASTTSASTACFLQPLEQACISYASSRYQQQRYDPMASRSTNSSTKARGHPRSAASIPSLRTTLSVHSSNASSPTNSHGHLTADMSKSKHTLRHQTTLPDLSLLGNSAPSQGMTSSFSRLRGEHYLPALPAPARLASGSYASDSSPVNTLVYDYSPATNAPSTGYARRQVARIPSTQLQPVNALRDVHSTLPVSALSALSVTPEFSGSNTDDSTLIHSRHTQKQHHRQSVSQEHYEHSSSAHLNSSIGGGGGWQLKTKILQPLSTWFRSTRQQQYSGHQAAVELEDEHDQKLSAYARDTRVHRSNNGQRRDSHLDVVNISPIYLDPPVSSSAML
ncbi:PHO85 cyclin-1 [Kickxella alabastrina]|uniref:PHO85 cyclin-1 n=1 Tax=Kickxella alabastrina TaxID=61397 RepID=A0ACC1IL47_9FUNG|nr:PHO85 cyclin-1 [Kickxella alabastrina]